MSQLGLSQTQAKGGLGSLFSAVPTVDSTSGLSGLLSKTGDLRSSLQGGAQIYDSFEKLGISKELAQPMVEIVKGYLDTYAGDGTTDLLVQGLGSFM